MRFSRMLEILLVTLLLASCAASGPLFQSAPPPDSGKALVYIYRPSNIAFSGHDAHFFINDRNVANLSTGGYTYFYLDPGTYNLKQKWTDDFKILELRLVVGANRTYFYRFFTGTGGDCTFGHICLNWSLQQIAEGAAMSEIAKNRYQVSK